MRPFRIVDVFTPISGAGNQLAVVQDARGLDTARMQRIAREFNFAETSFILPPANPAHDAHVRIFTPEAEMPFAGHPNVGTAFVIAGMDTLFGRPVKDRMLFEEKAGIVSVDVMRDSDRITGARCRAPMPLQIGEQVSTAIVADMAGLSEADILLGRFRPGFISVGAEFLIAEVTADALERARPSADAFRRHQPTIRPGGGFLALHLHTRDSNDPSRVDARMFAPLAGVPEDPATGSAAAALGACLSHLRPHETRFLLSQGRHIGRPSEIAVDVQGQDVWIGGACAEFASGTLVAGG